MTTTASKSQVPLDSITHISAVLGGSLGSPRPPLSSGSWVLVVLPDVHTAPAVRSVFAGALESLSARAIRALTWDQATELAQSPPSGTPRC